MKSIYGVFGMFVCIHRELQETLGKIFLNLKMAILGNRKNLMEYLRYLSVLHVVSLRKTLWKIFFSRKNVEPGNDGFGN